MPLVSYNINRVGRISRLLVRSRNRFHPADGELIGASRGCHNDVGNADRRYNPSLHCTSGPSRQGHVQSRCEGSLNGANFFDRCMSKCSTFGMYPSERHPGPDHVLRMHSLRVPALSASASRKYASLTTQASGSPCLRSQDGITIVTLQYHGNLFDVWSCL